MGDAAKPCFFKRNKERGIIEDDFRRASQQPDYLIMDDSGNGHSSKTEKGLPLKKGTPGNYGNSPRKGPHAISSSPNVPKNMGHAQGARTSDSHKDNIKRWLSDELNETDNWLDFRTGSKTPVINRPRKDTFQEGEDGHRWQDGRGCRSVRWQHQKDLTNIEISEMQTGGSGNIPQLLQLKPQCKNVSSSSIFLSKRIFIAVSSAFPFFHFSAAFQKVVI